MLLLIGFTHRFSDYFLFLVESLSVELNDIWNSDNLEKIGGEVALCGQVGKCFLCVRGANQSFHLVIKHIFQSLERLTSTVSYCYSKLGSDFF
ncbi:hypothetical protein RR42_m3747 [Cupriavidus basilensis]|uniref:Uncharacterized protein n=1 Tax=Cupriavidus basilensis TaxID=68895 RepID=A0A0C4Y6T6_9BURK|nr:hypothetical protein RR42_m3747 [Cupriavidus basilensis]